METVNIFSLFICCKKRDPKTIPDDEAGINNAYTVLFFDRYFQSFYIDTAIELSYSNAHR